MKMKAARLMMRNSVGRYKNPLRFGQEEVLGDDGSAPEPSSVIVDNGSGRWRP